MHCAGEASLKNKKKQYHFTGTWFWKSTRPIVCRALICIHKWNASHISSYQPALMNKVRKVATLLHQTAGANAFRTFLGLRHDYLPFHDFVYN